MDVSRIAGVAMVRLIAASFIAGAVVVAVTVGVVGYRLHKGTSDEQIHRSIVQHDEQFPRNYTLTDGGDSRVVTCDYSIPAGTGPITELHLGCVVPLGSGTSVH
jgi:hypothetical protein